MKRAQAFSILELLTVISLIVVLLSFTFSVANGIRHRAAVSRTKTELSSLAEALERFKLYQGDYPWVDGFNHDENAKLLYASLNGKWIWDSETQRFVLSNKRRVFFDPGKFRLKNPDDITEPKPDSNGDPVIIDSWDNTYIYAYKNNSNHGTTWEKAGFLLISMGSDGKLGSPIPSHGILDLNYFNLNEENADNLIYGY